MTANKSSYDPGYAGLIEPKATLPSKAYFEDSYFQQDLHHIWYRQWQYVCRSEVLEDPRSYRLHRIGDQEVVVLRDEHGALQAFHNTCRHRGSVLFTENAGKLRSDRITCPYHAWSYSLQGELQRTPSNFCQAGFDPTELPLYDVAVQEWRGFIFVNLNPTSPLLEAMDCGGESLANWPLEQLRVGHSYSKVMQCNWKIFWENFNECLHCPGVHPNLSKLVPLYRRSMMELKDDPHWQQNAGSDDPKLKGGLAPGVESWTADGKACDATFEGLTQEDIERGHTYEVVLPSLFIVGHVDYVRSVRLVPIGPEQTLVEAEWLFRPETLARDDFDAEAVASFAKGVLLEDAHASELNQRGIRSQRHQSGTLMAEEYDVYNFQEWVRAQWAE